jgi:hypothetical protein
VQHLEWAIPVAIVVIWFITTLVKKSEEDRAIQNRRRPVARPAEQEGTPPVVLTEIDRFLSEVNRRRQQAQERQTTARPRQQAQKQAKAPKPRPTVQRTGVKDVPPPAFPTTETSTPSLVREALTQAPVPQLLEVLPVAAEPAPMNVVGILASPISNAPPPTQRTFVSEEFMGMLGNTQNLRTAFILQEVLGQPKAVDYWRKHR